MNNKINTGNEKLNKKNGNKKIFIIVSIIVAVLLVGCIALVINNKKEEPINYTGHFYGKPSSIEDIELIEVVYNNGKDEIAISPDNVINYYTYDKDGNSIDNCIDQDTSDIINYIYKNDLKYLEEYKKVNNAKWSLSIKGPGRSCLISSKESEPEWFKELLKKLNVDEKGYISYRIK